MVKLVKNTPSQRGLVTTVYSGCCDVRIDGQTMLCNLAEDIAKTQKTSLAVGDRVLVRETGEDRLRVVEVLPRSTLLSRPDPLKPEIERVLVANIDRVAIVIATKNPRPRTGLIDRLWVAAQRGGANTLIVVNKMDLANTRARQRLEDMLADYIELDVKVMYISTQTGEGVGALQDELAGSVTALVGHSGVGKSSLINVLVPEPTARIGAVRAGNGKGRHTTSASTWFALEGHGAVIDTPGIRAFGLMDVGPDALRFYFPDIHDIAQRCYFSDCRHEEEPGCAVHEALDAGVLSEARYAAWLRLLYSEEDWRRERK